MLRYWIFLFLAIIFEVVGVSFMKAIDEALLKYGIMGSALALSYYFMALAIQKIAVGIAYAMWEVLGLILVIFISVLWFGEDFSFQEYIALVLAATGIILINMGESHHNDTPAKGKA